MIKASRATPPTASPVMPPHVSLSLSAPTHPHTNTQTQLIDVFLVYALASGGIQVREGGLGFLRAGPSCAADAAPHSPPPTTPTRTQFLYCLLGGKYPFNAFLASFLGHVSFFALTLALRQQLDPSTAADEFPGLAPERAVADYILANLVMFLAVWNYLG